MSTTIPLLTPGQLARLPERAREVVEYRKSGLNLNHIQGCPLDCAYCIRHTYGLWDQRQPRALLSDAEAVEQLVSHRYFQAHLTPIQLFNRATDPFLPAVRPHTFAVLENLDHRGLTNHVLVITRCVGVVNVGVIQRELGDWQCPEIFDRLKLAKRLLPRQKRYQLGVLVKELNLAEGLPGDLTPHRATYDVLVAARLFVRLATAIDGQPLSLEALRGEPAGDTDEAQALF